LYTSLITNQNNTSKNKKNILYNQTTEFKKNKENRLDTTAGVATGGGKGHGSINNNMNIASGMISCLSQGDDNI
jgi:hypothetical protein